MNVIKYKCTEHNFWVANKSYVYINSDDKALSTTRKIFGFTKHLPRRIHHLEHANSFSGDQKRTEAPGIPHPQHIQSTSEADK